MRTKIVLWVFAVGGLLLHPGQTPAIESAAADAGADSLRKTVVPAKPAESGSPRDMLTGFSALDTSWEDWQAVEHELQQTRYPASRERLLRALDNATALTPADRERLKRKITAGSYLSADEVIRALKK